MRGIPALILVAAMSLAGSVSGAAQEVPIVEFVGRAFAHGVPYEEALKYQSASTQRQLIAMLEAEEQRRVWVNAATVLGMIGDAGAAQALIAFASRGDGPLDPTRYSAKTAAIFALGYILNRVGDPAALAFLQAGLQPENWSSRVRWTSPFSPTPQRRNVQLSLAAVRALGVSGMPEAEQMLRNAPERVVGDPAVRSALSATVQDALKANQDVRRLGLRQFLSRQQNRH